MRSVERAQIAWRHMLKSLFKDPQIHSRLIYPPKRVDLKKIFQVPGMDQYLIWMPPQDVIDTLTVMNAYKTTLLLQA